jgi:hypothetical protein
MCLTKCVGQYVWDKMCRTKCVGVSESYKKSCFRDFFDSEKGDNMSGMGNRLKLTINDGKSMFKRRLKDFARKMKM